MDQIKMDSVAPVSDVAYGTHVKDLIRPFQTDTLLRIYVYTGHYQLYASSWSGYFNFQCMSFLLWLEFVL